MKPGAGWRWTRRACQVPAFVAILVAPLLGGWQRLDRNYLSAWKDHGWDLPVSVLENLPLGDAPSQAHAANQLLGGGVAGEYLGVAAIDPVGGLLALLSAPVIYISVVVSWLIPVVLALMAGRFFCGWMCPFGSLARGIAGILDRLPWRIPSFVPPRLRVVRFVLLGLALTAGAIGSQWLLYLLLPHLLLQQSAYAVWLMGGGGAALGALLGLLGVGVFFGPTVYCATVCPTGAALSLAGRRRVVRLEIIDKPACGAHCDLCDRACWLFLHPSEGEPGPDCDNCARCVEVCPRDNLRVVARPPWTKRKASLVPLVPLIVGVWLASTNLVVAAPADDHKPALLLDARREVGATNIAISIVDLTGVRLEADDPRQLDGLEVSVYVVRGPRGEPDERGRLPARGYYQGPLRLRMVGTDGLDHELAFESPQYPHSTPNRSIYREHVKVVLRPGDAVILAPIDGWFSETQRWEIPAPNAGREGLRMLAFMGVGVLLFGGVTALALGLRPREPGAARGRIARR